MEKKREMTPKERLAAVYCGEEPDRTPLLGGWIACPDHIAAIMGVTMEEYWARPEWVSIEAYRKLGMDGLADICIPKNREDFRIVDASSYSKASSEHSLEETIAIIDAMPEAEEIEASFDFEGEYGAFRDHQLKYQDKLGDMLFHPAQWSAGAKLNWYSDFGYENYFMVIGLYPDHAQKLMEVGGAYGYCRGRVIARAMEEGIYPRAVFLGEDICTQRGPMVSPAYLEEHYAPQLKHGLQPLLDAGCKPVWHCDGDVRPLLDMLIGCGVQGFQGFQPECGMRIEDIVQRRTREGNRLLIYGPMSVTTELPVFTPDEVRRRVRQVIEICRGNADLVLFTSNTINPDIPLENIYAMYEAAREGV